MFDASTELLSNDCGKDFWILSPDLMTLTNINQGATIEVRAEASSEDLCLCEIVYESENHELTLGLFDDKSSSCVAMINIADALIGGRLGVKL